MPKEAAGEESRHASDIWVLLFPRDPATDGSDLEPEQEVFQPAAQ